MGKRSRKEQQPERGETPGPPATDDCGATNRQGAGQAAPEQSGETPPAGPAAAPSFALSGPSSTPLGGTRRRFRGWRGWLLRLALLVLSPILCLGLLEAGLRLGGYGYPTTFFLGPDSRGNYTVNYRFGWRFFPRRLATQPHPCTLSAKPPGTVRIFVFGGSAAQGFPDPSFSFGRILAVMLGRQYPGKQVEVVNAAMPAINSHAVLEIARDCAAHEPDLFLVYLGNNEVVGPYGPGTGFKRSTPGLGMIRASLWAKSTRVGELLGDASAALRRDRSAVDRAPDMETYLANPVPADDPRLAAVYDNCRRNLTDLCGVARRAHAAVVLCSVAVNLRDCPPLASLHRPDLSAEELAKWESIYQAGCAAEASNRWQEAARHYEAAEKIDDRFAELQFRMARCLMKADRNAEARRRFELARDLDVLRFRADSRINAIVREVAAAQGTGHHVPMVDVRFVDAERALAENDPGGAGLGDPRPTEAGGDLFYEHVHLTFAGNYVLARAVLDPVAAALPQLGGKQGEVPSRQQCAELLALTPGDEYQAAAVMVNMTSRPPFSNQLDHALRQAAARRRRDDLHRRALLPQAIQAARTAYDAALARSPGDWDLNYHFGALALDWERPKLAEEHLRIAAERAPWDARTHNLLGSALAGQGRLDEAIAQYRVALEINPVLVEAEKNLAVALADAGRFDEAVTHFHKALEINPEFVEAYDNFGRLLAGQGRLDEAIVQYRAALKIDPDFAEAQDDIGQALFRQGLPDEAAGHFRKAVEVKPTFAEAHNNLALLLVKRGRFDEAVVHYRKALEIKPDYAGAHFNLGMALADRGQLDEAIVHFQKALEIKPDFIQARRSLEALRGNSP